MRGPRHRVNSFRIGLGFGRGLALQRHAPPRALPPLPVRGAPADEAALAHRRPAAAPPPPRPHTPRAGVSRQRGGAAVARRHAGPAAGGRASALGMCRAATRRTGDGAPFRPALGFALRSRLTPHARATQPSGGAGPAPNPAQQRKVCTAAAVHPSGPSKPTNVNTAPPVWPRRSPSRRGGRPVQARARRRRRAPDPTSVTRVGRAKVEGRPAGPAGGPARCGGRGRLRRGGPPANANAAPPCAPAPAPVARQTPPPPRPRPVPQSPAAATPRSGGGCSPTRATPSRTCRRARRTAAPPQPRGARLGRPRARPPRRAPPPPAPTPTPARAHPRAQVHRPGGFTGQLLRATGLRAPLLVKGDGSSLVPPLGVCLPEDFDVEARALDAADGDERTVRGGGCGWGQGGGGRRAAAVGGGGGGPARCQPRARAVP